MEILVILNSLSGYRAPELIKKEFIKCMELFPVEYELFESQNPEQAYLKTIDAVNNGVKLVIAIGGDGTVNQVINALAFTDVCLGIIPNGTGNLLATTLGIPLDVNKALEIIFEGTKKKIDLGKINNQYFSIIAGCGFDADIMKNTNKSVKKFLGYIAYFLEGFKLALFPRRAVFRITYDGKKVKKRAVNVLFINTANILGNFITLVPNASMTDGLLDICVISPENPIEYIPVLWNILTKQNCEENEHNKSNKILHLKAQHIHLDCRPKRSIQVDGDVLGYPPVDIVACPAALAVMAPQKVDTFFMNPEEFFKSLLSKTFTVTI